MGRFLLKLCPLIDKKGPETSSQTNTIIIAFVPLKKLDPPVKTFHDFAIALTSMVTKAGHNCDEIHIVLTHTERIARMQRGKEEESQKE